MRKFGRRPRGGRAPQVNDGTFEGILAPYGNGIRPHQPFFNAIAYAPPGGGGAELWALRRKGQLVGTPTNAKNWNPDLKTGVDPAVKEEHKSLFMDEVEDVPFNPSNQSPIEALSTAHALREYAHSRYVSRFGATDDLSNWQIKLIRPGLIPNPTIDEERIVHRHMYSIHQHDERNQDEGLLVAWVWVPHLATDQAAPPLGREVWLYFKPNELEGYRELGEVPAGLSTRYTSTVLRFQVDPVNEEETEDLDLSYTEQAIGTCVQLAIAQTASQHVTATDIAPLDYYSSTVIAHS